MCIDKCNVKTSQMITNKSKKSKFVSKEDLEVIGPKIRSLKLFQRMHPNVLQEILGHGAIEHIDKGVVLFRQGDPSFNWYAVISGSLDVHASQSAQNKDVSTLCTLGAGTSFGETVLTNKPHSMTIITNESCMLLRIRKLEFQEIWDRHSHLMGDIVTPFSGLRYLSKNSSLNRSMSLTTPPDSTSNVVPIESNGTLINRVNSLTSSSTSSTIINPMVHRNSVNDVNLTTIPTMIIDQSSSSSNGTSTTNHQNDSNNNKSNNHTPLLLNLTNIRNGSQSAKNPPSELIQIGTILRTLILAYDATLIRDRKIDNSIIYRKCLVGSEMVDWLISVSTIAPTRVHSRSQAATMWQVLMEEDVLTSPTNEPQFYDRYCFYEFCFEDDNGLDSLPSLPTMEERRKAEAALTHCLALLNQLAPEANFRLILRKPSQDRTGEEVDAVYEELMHIKALSHLGDSVRRELAQVIAFEKHPRKGTVLFNQGDAGKSWFIILKGTVNVVIVGKGVVCTLNEGDDFGKLALVNDAPRAATIITNEDNCSFLRVDKEDFNRIIRDAEANTAHLKEHGRDVLLLRKMANKSGINMMGSHYKYMVMAGTPEKMLEHLLETRIDNQMDIPLDNPLSSCLTSPLRNPMDKLSFQDTFLEDFLLTHIIFLPIPVLIAFLLKHYTIDQLNTRAEKEFVIASKRAVIRFTREWLCLVQDAFHQNCRIEEYLARLNQLAHIDFETHGNLFKNDVLLVETMVNANKRYKEECVARGVQKWKSDLPGPIRRISNNGIADTLAAITSSSDEWIVMNTRFNSIQPKDEILSRIYCADHTYTTLKMPIDSSAGAIKTTAADKLGMTKDEDELILVEVKSSGERIPFHDEDLGNLTGLSVNGRAFVSLIDHIDALTSLPEQEGPKHSSLGEIEDISSRDIAYYLTFHSWILFQNVHEYEFIYHVFGRVNFGQITANLDLFLRLFDEIQYWVVTEICLTQSLSKRINILRKFIKIAGICKEHQDLSTFLAITMGLSNIAVSRLTQTWDRLPNKVKRTFSQYEALIEPSRSYRRYRLYLSKLEPPIIPFPSLIVKDIELAHEGNKTYLEKGLVNFEKMHMIAQPLRIFRFYRSRPLKLGLSSDGNGNTGNGRGLSSTANNMVKIDQYMKDLKVIDNQRILLNLSHSLEHRKL
ncbi:exchange protein directly activated by cAMP [Brevipalpus obovatus]|uniref:exchange protein directly activated by cAMP n=1 Tax=Brevipalpus obovatus TaxID=246614 RepID=UPI003D9E6808